MWLWENASSDTADTEAIRQRREDCPRPRDLTRRAEGAEESLGWPPPSRRPSGKRNGHKNTRQIGRRHGVRRWWREDSTPRIAREGKRRWRRYRTYPSSDRGVRRRRHAHPFNLDSDGEAQRLSRQEPNEPRDHAGRNDGAGGYGHVALHRGSENGAE